MYRLQVDFGKTCGKIKPMHAVNNMPTVPFNSGTDLYGKMREAHIPYGRLHDTGGAFGGAHYVDIPNVFPNFDADENDPASYDFAFTDALLCGMVEHGVKPFYRLGVTIENNHGIKPYNIYPPKDPHKWARICEHVVRHYNEGWANGYHMEIEHWEIWNEPDNTPAIEDNPMWKGTKEQYFALYEAAATHLKRCFPHLKIGGYASCGFYALGGADVSKTANISPRKQYFIEFFEDFLRFASERKLPLDFFSWHSYGSVKDNIKYAQYPRKRLDAYGYTDTEIYLNEWNPGLAERGTLRDATNIAAMMCALHATPTDMLMYYDMRCWSPYCGPVNPLNLQPFKAFYAFLAFGRLYELGTEVQSFTEGDNLFALAATDGKASRVLLVNQNAEQISVQIAFNGAELAQARLFGIDEGHDFDALGAVGDTLVLPANAVYLIEL